MGRGILHFSLVYTYDVYEKYLLRWRCQEGLEGHCPGEQSKGHQHQDPHQRPGDQRGGGGPGGGCDRVPSRGGPPRQQQQLQQPGAQRCTNRLHTVQYRDLQNNVISQFQILLQFIHLPPTIIYFSQMTNWGLGLGLGLPRQLQLILHP